MICIVRLILFKLEYISIWNIKDLFFFGWTINFYNWVKFLSTEWTHILTFCTPIENTFKTKFMLATCYLGLMFSMSIIIAYRTGPLFLLLSYLLDHFHQLFVDLLQLLHSSLILGSWITNLSSSMYAFTSRWLTFAIRRFAFGHNFVLYAFEDIQIYLFLSFFLLGLFSL